VRVMKFCSASASAEGNARALMLYGGTSMTRSSRYGYGPNAEV
jgi:hypothetical protein